MENQKEIEEFRDDQQLEKNKTNQLDDSEDNWTDLKDMDFIEFGQKFNK